MQQYSRGKTIAYVCLLVILGFTLGCSEFIVIGIEPDIADGLGITLAQAGQLVSVFAAVYAVATPVLALVTGRFRRYHLLVTYLAVFVFGNAVSAFGLSFAAQIFARVLMGLVSGALLAVAITYISDFVSAKRAPSVFAAVYASYSVAMVLATSLGKLTAEFAGWRVALIAVFALAVVVSVVLVVVMPREGSTDEPATVREQLPLLRDPRIIAGFFIFVFDVGATYIFYGYITPYLQQELGISAVGASSVLLVYGGVCMVSNILSGWFATHYDVGRLVLVCAAQAVLLALLWAVGKSLVPALVIIMLVALLMYIPSTPCATMFLHTARADYPKALTLAASIEPMSFNVGIAVGTAVGGQVVTLAGIGSAGIFGAAFALIAIACVALTQHFVTAKQH